MKSYERYEYIYIYVKYMANKLNQFCTMYNDILNQQQNNKQLFLARKISLYKLFDDFNDEKKFL